MKFNALLVVIGLLAITPLNAQDASLRLESVPDGADIMLNGKLAGITPATISLEAGSFRVLIQKAGFEPWVRTVELLAGSSPTLRADLNPIDPTKPPLPVPQDDKKLFRIGGGVTPPKPLLRVDPSYSELARAAAYSGTVVVQIVVDSTGAPRDIRVIRSLGLGLDEKAIEAVSQWTFQPGMKDGQPVNVRATIEVNFRLVDDNRKLPGWRLSRTTFRPPQGGTAPVLVEFTRPRPHRDAKSAFAKLEFEVDEEGRVQNPRVVTDPALPIGTDLDPALEKNLLAAAKLWRFTPAQEGGKAVSSRVIFDFVWGASGGN